MVLDEETIGREDKQWCVRQWEVFREKFLGRLWEYEYDHEGEMFYHEEAEHSLTEDDDRFFHVINKCRTDIRSDNIDNFKNLYALKAFADGWSIYTHRTAGAYESKFTVFFDNSDIQHYLICLRTSDGSIDGSISRYSPAFERVKYISTSFFV